MQQTDAVSRRSGVLAVVSAANFAQLGARLLLSPVVPLVLLEFDASKSNVGLALTGMWAVYALFQFPSGVLADRYGERALVLTGLAGTAFGATLVAFSPSILAFTAFAVVLGGGAGLLFAPASSLLSRLYDARGRALGVLTAAGAVAGVVYPAVGGFVGVRTDWRVAVGLGGVVAVPVFVATVWLIPSMPPARPNRSLWTLFDVRRIGTLLARPGVAYTTMLAVMVGFTFQAFSSFFPTFLVEYRGLETDVAGVAFGVAFALSSVAQPIAGRFSDATSRNSAMAISVTLAGSGLLVLLFVGNLLGLLAGIGLLGAGISWPGVVQARFMDQFTDEERGFGFGLVRTVYMLLAASGSVVVGTLADLGGWTLGYGAVVGLLAVCLVLLGANRAFSLGL